MEQSKRSRVLTVASVTALSLAVNLSFFRATPPQKPQQDAESYDTIARLLVGYGPADKSPSENLDAGLQGLFRRGFAYPALITLVYLVAGSPNYTLVCLLQAVILPLTVLLTYALGLVAFDHKTGVLASLLYALYLPAVWHTNFLLTETVLALVLTLTLCLMALYLKGQRPLVSFLFGLSGGMLSISHPLWLVFPLFVVVSLYFQCRHLDNRWLVARKLAVVMVGLAAVLIPWNAFRIAKGLPQLGQGGAGFGGGGGFTFYVSSRVETRGLTVPEDYLVVETYFPPGRLREVYEKTQNGEVTIEPILLAIIAEKLASDDKSDWVLTDFDYYRAGIENWLHKPLLIPKLLSFKIYWFLFDVGGSPSYPLPQSVLYNQEWRVLFKYLNWPFVFLAVGGLALVARCHPDKLVLFVALMFNIVSVIITYPDNRYKYPSMSAASLLVAVAVLWIVRSLALYWRRRGELRAGSGKN